MDVWPPRPARSGGLLTGGLVLAVLALPFAGWLGWRRWERSRLPHNERAAMRVLYELAQLEAAFKNGDLDHNWVCEYWTGDVAGFLSVQPDRTFDPDRRRIARADPSRPDAEPNQGYWFVPLEADADGSPFQMNGQPRHPSAFAFCAYPAYPGRSGKNVFIIRESGGVFSNWDVHRRPRAWPPESVLRVQWSKPG